MQRIMAIAVVGMLALVMVIGGQGSREGLANRLTQQSVVLTKTDRIAPMFELASLDEADGEWALDCLDSFGPEAFVPDETALRSCLN